MIDEKRLLNKLISEGQLMQRKIEASEQNESELFFLALKNQLEMLRSTIRVIAKWPKKDKWIHQRHRQLQMNSSK